MIPYHHHLHPVHRLRWRRALKEAAGRILRDGRDPASRREKGVYDITVKVIGATSAEVEALFDLVADRAHAMGCAGGVDLLLHGAPGEDVDT